MKEKLIAFETAKLAKEKGFHGNMGKGYGSDGKIDTYRGHAPFPVCTQSLLQKWLREEHGIHIQSFLTWSLSYSFSVFKGLEAQEETNDGSYEEMLEDALVIALNLIP